MLFKLFKPSRILLQSKIVSWWTGSLCSIIKNFMKWLPLILFGIVLYGCNFDIGNSYETGKSVYSKDPIYTPTGTVKPVSERETYLKAYDRTLSLWPVPYREFNVQTTYGKAHIIASGPENAPPIVLLHGMNSSSTMWYPNIAELSKDHSVYAIDDLTEPGKSEMIQPIHSVKDLISWYIEIINKLQLDQFTLIGASKGGWLAVNLALHLNDRVQKLVLVSPLQTFGLIPPGTRILSAIRYGLNPNRHRLNKALKSMSTNISHIDSLYITQFYLASKISDPAKLLGSFTPYSKKQLKKLKMPVLVLIGDQDIINKKFTAKKASETMAHSETVIIPAAGHFLSMDQTEITNTTIMEFLDSERITAREERDER